MIELISIHIPKTGGTSFYQMLQQVYGESVSKSYKRKHYLKDCENFASFQEAIPSQIRVLHGHLYYAEVKDIHQANQAKVICWLRDPLERVVSNYLFFKAGLQQPKRNFASYLLNKHRKEESLLDYARKDENRNRMTSFLDGIDLEDLYFFGFLSSFEKDLARLGTLLNWPKIEIPKLNQGTTNKKQELLNDPAIYQELRQLNTEDMALYQSAKAIHAAMHQD